MQLVSRREEKLLTSLVVIKLNLVANVASALVCRGTSFVEQRERVLVYSNTVVGEHYLLLLRGKTVDIAQDMMSSDFLPGMSSSKYSL